MERSATIERKTHETEVKLTLNLDGKGLSQIDTGIAFMDHMLNLMTAHGFMDMTVTARGDTQIDDHHTVEDLGICLGEALRQALGKREGIRRYGQALIPMDEALARVVLDISNRPFLAYHVKLEESKAGTFDVHLVREFFRALAHQGGITLHVDLLSGDDPHHIAESIFKAFGRALDQALSPEERLANKVPSTKGVL
jgi:imidazoleglycerol-phosphate dehydratase